jgi:hypothetical protein
VSTRKEVLEVLELGPRWVLRGSGSGAAQPDEVAAQSDVAMATVATPVIAPTARVARDPMQSDAPAYDGPDLDAPIFEDIPFDPVFDRASDDQDDTVAVPARPDPVLAMDWPALKDAVRACTACALAPTRTQTVFGVGDEAADWLFVGEGPGADEDRLGEPFVGQAGKLLDNMLAAIDTRAWRERLHREHREVPSAGQPQSGRRRGDRMPAVPRTAGGTDPPEADRRARQGRGDESARPRCADRQSPREGPRLPRRTADRHVSPRVPPAHAAREGTRVGGPLLRARDDGAVVGAGIRRGLISRVVRPS